MESAARCAPSTVVGRLDARRRVEACLRVGRNVLIEGPVGVGKTHLGLAVATSLGAPLFRVDGDGRFTEQKLTGWFDPPVVVREGYGWSAFVPGPLAQAMSSGGVLFINELNRLPEGVQNVLLPAIDEGFITVPRLGEVRAKEGFRVLATQNPREFVATSHLSEALLDRFDLIVLEHQPEDEEVAIVLQHARPGSLPEPARSALAREAVRIARATRDDPAVRRGASVRAAIAIAEIATALVEDGAPLASAVAEASSMALPTRIELEPDFDAEGHSEGTAAVVARLTDAALARAAEADPKKA